MIYLYATLLILLNAVWLFLVVLGLPGTWLMIISAMLLGWWRSYADPQAALMFSPLVLVVAIILALLGEAVEFFAGVIGSRKAGGSRWAAAGAIVGTLVGGLAGTFLIPIPLFGSLAGACIGAAAGAMLVEFVTGREVDFVLKVGLGAGVGRLSGTLAKLGVGVMIWLILAIAAFWP